MLTLLTYPAGYGQFSLSPFCVKAAYLLNLSGQNWKRQDLNDPRKMPHSKLPVLRTEDRLVPDSDGIRVWLESRGAHFDAGLTDRQAGTAQALVRMAEEHLYLQLIMDRWGNDAVWPTIRDRLFAEIPSLLRRPIANNLRRVLVNGLKTHGIARFSAQERLDRARRDLDGIRAVLGDQAFLMGDRVTSADLSVAPMLAAIRSTPVRTDLSRAVANDPVLSDYADRVAAEIPLPT